MILPARPPDRHDFPEQAAAGCRTERDNRRRPYNCPLMIQPPFTALELIGVWSLVQPALATRLEFEVLDCISDEDVVARNAGRRERLIEDAPGRPNEGLAGDILFVAWLFPDQHELGTPSSFAGDDLGRKFVEWAAPAFSLGGG